METYTIDFSVALALLKGKTFRKSSIKGEMKGEHTILLHKSSI